MKRPLAVLGLGTAVMSLISANISFKLSIILTFGMVVIFCTLAFNKKLRKYKIALLCIVGAVLYMSAFFCAQLSYINASNEVIGNDFMGVVCTSSQESDYAYTYIIKPVGKSYKIRYVSKDFLMLDEGDIVTGSLCSYSDYDNEDYIESDLSQKIYFTFFEDGESGNSLEFSGKTDKFYFTAGLAKKWFSDTIDTYLPSESGTIAKAMTIGEKSDLSSRTLDGFSYSGTVHLLVISGLHITLFSAGILRWVERATVKKRITVPLGLICLLSYCAVTGFSVSVLRAGLMMSVYFLGKIFDKGADSINSISVSVIIILLLNPFASACASFWFSVLSTLSILLFINKTLYWLKNKSKYRKIMMNPVISAAVTNVAVSIITAVFTLPVYIANFKVIPTASVIANLVMMNLATFLILTAFLGVFLHTLSFTSLAEGVFLITGLISKFLKGFTDAIGFSRWSTVSISHVYYKYFLIFSFIALTFAFTVKKNSKKFQKAVSVFIAILFLLLSVYCNYYYYTTPSIELVGDKSYPYILINSKGQNAVLAIPDRTSLSQLKFQLNTYNKKEIDNIILLESTDTLPSQLINLYSEFCVNNTLFCFEPPKVFEGRGRHFTDSLTLSDDITIAYENNGEFIEIFCRNKKIILTQKLFENMKEYDIIIAYGENAAEIKENAENEFDNTAVYALGEKRYSLLYLN